MRRRAAIFLLSAFLASATTTRSWSQSNCPANTLNCNFFTSHPTLPQGSCTGDWQGTASVSYDATRGQTFAYALGFLTAGYAEVVDSFTVSNVQPGTPLTFSATLSASLACSGQSHGCGACGAGITGPDGTTQSDRIEGCYGHGNSAAPLLSVTVQVPAGQTFRISYTVEAEANEGGYAQASTQLAFQDLPPGASIQSCYGYRQDFAVPTKTVTWGRVKVLYR